MPINVLPLCLKQTFPPIIWIFTEGEGDGIESRLPFKIFSTLLGQESTGIMEVDLFSQKSVLEKWYFDLTFTDFQTGS